LSVEDAAVFSVVEVGAGSDGVLVVLVGVSDEVLPEEVSPFPLVVPEDAVSSPEEVVAGCVSLELESDEVPDSVLVEVVVGSEFDVLLFSAGGLLVDVELLSLEAASVVVESVDVVSPSPSYKNLLMLSF